MWAITLFVFFTPPLYIICHETLGTLSCLLTLGFNQWDDSRHDVNRWCLCYWLIYLGLRWLPRKGQVPMSLWSKKEKKGIWNRTGFNLQFAIQPSQIQTRAASLYMWKSNVNARMIDDWYKTLTIVMDCYAIFWQKISI